MIAALIKVRERDRGKLIVVREPAGLVTSLVGSKKPVFAWLVQALGLPIECNGEPAQTIYIADPCLSPLAEMTGLQLQELITHQSQTKFEEMLRRARSVLDVHQISDAELNELLKLGGERALVTQAIETVETATALHELGFRPEEPGSSVLQWTGIHDGIELRVSAAPDMFDRWCIAGVSLSARQWQYDERVLPNAIERGKVFLTILNIWRAAFGQTLVPDALSLGKLYERHLGDMRRLNPGMPMLNVDAEVFRAILKLLAKRHLDARHSSHDVHCSFSGGLLWLRIDNTVYTCPAYGQWMGDFLVSAKDLVALPPHGRRGRILIEQQPHCIVVNGYSMTISESVLAVEADYEISSFLG